MELLLFNSLELRILAEVLGAMFLGAVIGFERELHQKSAGLRTHMIVCSSATLIVILSNQLTQDMVRSFPEDSVQVDPSRVIVAIIMGVSFIGAGTIIRQQNGQEAAVVGLTTAATLLFTSAIGIAVAIGRYLIACILTFLLVGITWGLGFFQAFLAKRRAS